MQIGAHIIVRGLVQGVGFRYFAYRHAVNLGLTGWVRNLYNDDVELEVEGGTLPHRGAHQRAESGAPFCASEGPDNRMERLCQPVPSI